MAGLPRPLRTLLKFVQHTAERILDYPLLSDPSDWKIAVRPYDTYGTPERLWFLGRVLRDHGLAEPTVHDSPWKNLVRTFHALESDEAPGAAVEITTRGHRRVTRADDEGFVDCYLDNDDSPRQPGWHAIRVKHLGQDAEKLFRQNLSPAQGKPATVPTRDRQSGHCLIPDPASQFAIISDIDDTVLQSAVTRPIQMLKLLCFGNAHTRAAVEGTPGLYQALVRGGAAHQAIDGPENPVFYVSSSPWSLQPMLSKFMEVVGLPRGPMMLRDMGIGRDGDAAIGHGHKEIKIAHILETYPTMKAVLLGDAGQEDAAIYGRLCERFPDQIIVAYIRHVDAMPSDRVVRAVAAAHDRGAEVLLLPSTEAITADAERRGLLTAEAGPRVDNASDTTTRPHPARPHLSVAS